MRAQLQQANSVTDNLKIIMINIKTQILWKNWIKVTQDRCHLNFELEDNNLYQHINICLKASSKTANRISNDIKTRPKLILDIGSSVGFNSIGVADKYKDSIIFAGLKAKYAFC